MTTTAALSQSTVWIDRSGFGACDRHARQMFYLGEAIRQHPDAFQHSTPTGHFMLGEGWCDTCMAQEFGDSFPDLLIDSSEALE